MKPLKYEKFPYNPPPSFKQNINRQVIFFIKTAALLLLGSELRSRIAERKFVSAILAIDHRFMVLYIKPDRITIKIVV
jgi:hypothetical protein